MYIYIFFSTESYSHTYSYTQTCFDPKICVSTSTISPSIHFLHRLSLTSGIGLWTKSSRLVIAHETTPQLSENETHETHRLAIDSWDNWTNRLNILRVSHSFFDKHDGLFFVITWIEITGALQNYRQNLDEFFFSVLQHLCDEVVLPHSESWSRAQIVGPARLSFAAKEHVFQVKMADLTSKYGNEM